jgi:hypothetical protein
MEFDGYLDRNGPGLHHVALRTDDIEAALAVVNCSTQYTRNCMTARAQAENQRIQTALSKGLTKLVKMSAP